jgi:RimJ/RimL family protein N-acetyltransferase
MIIEPFIPAHIPMLKLQQAQAIMQPFIDEPGYGEQLAATSEAFSCFVNDEIIAIIGIIPQWENRAVAWGLIGENAGPHFISITKAIHRFIEIANYRRIEAFVDTEFEQGHRWMKIMGFKKEGRMAYFDPNGRDYDLYAKITRVGTWQIQ